MTRTPPGWAEHRLAAVLEVLNGAPFAEGALRYGASRQSNYKWKNQYEQDGHR
jgi:transposase-like protein